MTSPSSGAEAEKGPSYVALHTIGRQDDINPPEGAHEARKPSFFWMARFCGCFQKYIYPKMDDLGVPLFSEASMWVFK